MRKLISGIVFLFGGLSGSCVLRGTGSSEMLSLFGMVLCIWGSYEISQNKQSEEEEDELLLKPNELLLNLSAFKHPKKYIGCGCYDIKSHDYFGELQKVNIETKIVSIKTDSKVIVEKSINLILILIEHTDLDELPIFFDCQYCKTNLELDDTEQKQKSFTCPICNTHQGFSN